MDEEFLSRDRKGIGLRLALSREALGYSQKDFAEEAGLKSNAYNQYESGTNKPHIEAGIKLRDRYGLTLDWIYCGDASGLKYDVASTINALRKLRLAKSEQR